MKFLLKLLPKQYREIVEIGLDILSVVDTPQERAEAIALVQRIWGNLDTFEEREEVLLFAIGMFKDRQVTVAEWAQLGKKLGVLGKQED